MSNIEQQIKDAAEKAVVKFVTEGSWAIADYSQRVKLPADLLKEVWALVDREALKKKLAQRIESELADRIMNQIAAELATDIKQILSVQERREAVRALAREHMDAIMATGVVG